ncbi:LacI family DNA-binding transcriptional regulator [Homoserinibacter sp. YIM 151385]|nr:LacI family DNA-binding transcriptional regulator [Homoserinibacter sp. YIM 151385]WBU39421.1 LacI family DNA-binding transcriptional regulator [Homoserinibacter sp. YIM 151385]
MGSGVPRATVKDVAALAGVSPKTVSNVVGGTVFVKPETRERVEAAMAELDYVPNLSARGLRNGRTGVVALALPDLGTAYSADLTRHFVQHAHRRGYAVQIEETGGEPSREYSLISKARSHLIDGVVLNPVRLEDSAVEHADRLPPAVLIGEVEQDRADQVRIDSTAAARQMTEHLIERGARRIAALGAPGPGLDTSTSRQRLQGYREALAAAGLPADRDLEMPCDDWTISAGADGTAALLDAGTAVDAVFGFTDSLALGALSALSARGVRVPADVLVAGFDDVEAARFAVPPLTTIGFSREAFAGAALDLLLERIEDRGGERRVVEVPTELIARASTAS